MATEGATVPSARVDETTSEPFFAPETVDRLQKILEKQMAEGVGQGAWGRREVMHRSKR